MTKIKQVIVIRRDLNMRRGKEIAQGSHASMEFLIDPLRTGLRADGVAVPLTLTTQEAAWIVHGAAKICLQVASEADLVSCHQAALAKGLKSYLIRDSGRTEFHGEPTLTACAIGPDEAARIDEVTGGLTLY